MNRAEDPKDIRRGPSRRFIQTCMFTAGSVRVLSMMVLYVLIGRAHTLKDLNTQTVYH